MIKNYPVLSAVIGGRDGMDCNRRVWMIAFYLYNTSSIIGFVLAVGDVGDNVLQTFMYNEEATAYLYLFHPFLCIRGGRNGWMALKQLSSLSYPRPLRFHASYQKKILLNAHTYGVGAKA